ncbi:chemotaxis protein CheA [Methylotuvimicrobium alcaliphilum]|uniref:Chemotaxis protein CheA n=1 Tax=Methylotuvimicrobium alcaliphilum (strain DSM 19304 / NCIMB 14124 / VKM B-2133 / 20Z) TaxID=1091494 RepID=G4T176_META2|nr:chemotaxis protein CheA [Methylotuvimicrobium alcaliphilum]CCE24607.1 CheA signal transduction histidine kinase [Methylotuvimicrobium alcaliphilum 20Z]
MSELDAAIQTFVQEAEELLAEMELALLGLEDNPDDSESINSVFRAMHTIKGSSGLFGFDSIVAFAHEAETVLDQVRRGQREIDGALISTLLNCKDHTSKLIEHCLTEAEQELPQELKLTGESLIKQLGGATTKQESMPVEADSKRGSSESSETEDDTNGNNWVILLEFGPDALRNGMDPLSFIRYLKTLGDIVDILTSAPDLPIGETMDPESCYLHFKIVFRGNTDKQGIESVFEFAEDDCEIRIIPPHSQIEHYLDLLAEPSDEDGAQVERLGEMLINIGALTPKEVAKALQRQSEDKAESPEQAKPIGEILVEQQSAEQPVVEQALKKQQSVKQKIAAEANYIRVDSEKLGKLINLVGELVISGAAMRMMVDRHGLSDVEEVAVSMNDLVSEIRDTALELRMVAIGETFSRFRRVVRDVSNELNKQIELKITGGETELDKTVVEKINDPLTHLIRNSLDHGIEMPEQRRAAGKPEQGTVHLNAYHDSGHIVIQIADDGAGLNDEKIRTKAIANGLITPDQVLTKQEVFDLIFEAGLSTKDEASNLSGRGVGMDVVRRNIEALRGSVSLDSEPGQGTTVTIHLPLTLAIIDGFMVEAEQECYIIPLSMVEECVEMSPEECEVDEIQHYVNLRGEVMPYLRLGDYFNNRKQHSNIHRESMVVVRFGQTKVGFVVDKLHGEHQTVIKPLGKVFEQLKGISGATVLGSGDVALILDVQGLVQFATRDKSRASIGLAG